MSLAFWRLREERGFTLMELLVAMAAGTIVAMATLAIVIGSVHFTSNTGDRVDANQQGRVAMERITQALASTCVIPSLAPVLAGSTSSSISFYSSFTDGPTVTPNLVTVSLASTTPAPLILTTQPLTGTAPNWTTTTTGPSTFTLVSHAAPGRIANATQPLFQYYSYGTVGQPALIPLSGTAALTSSQAASVVMVTINLQALPTDNWSAGNRAADFSDSVLLRLSPASTSASVSNSPCT